MVVEGARVTLRLPWILSWFGTLFNCQPQRWRQRGPYTIYFTGRNHRELSAVKPDRVIWYTPERWSTLLPWKEPR